MLIHGLDMQCSDPRHGICSKGRSYGQTLHTYCIIRSYLAAVALAVLGRGQPVEDEGEGQCCLDRFPSGSGVSQ